MKSDEEYAGVIFTKNREGFLVSSLGWRECTSCRTIFKQDNTLTQCNECNCARVKSMSPEYKMWNRAKQRAKAKGMCFNITVDDITIPERCPILGIPLIVHSGKSGAYKDSPSLDRVDNERGYEKDNILVISQLANSMKGAANEEELIAFANYILEVYGEDN